MIAALLHRKNPQLAKACAQLIIFTINKPRAGADREDKITLAAPLCRRSCATHERAALGFERSKVAPSYRGL